MFYIMSLPSIYCKPHLPFCRDPGPSGSLALKVLSANTNLYYVTHLPKVTELFWSNQLAIDVRLGPGHF